VLLLLLSLLWSSSSSSSDRAAVHSVHAIAVAVAADASTCEEAELRQRSLD
jgi:hypothetical protein